MSKSRTSSDRGRVVVVTGPSGVGKTTVCERVLRRDDVDRVITATTRGPRPGEVDGRDYHFMTREAFIDARDRGAFLEWAEVYDRFYGTPKAGVESIVERGHDAMLIIDVQGAAQVKASGIDALFIFLDPPDLDTLRERLRRRATESDDQLATRLAKAEAEIAEATWFDHRVVNRNVDAAAEDVERLITARRETRA